MTAVNLAEVVKKLREKGVPKLEVEAILSDLQSPIEAGPQNTVDALAVGEIAAADRSFGLSLGDSVCLATAHSGGFIAVTAEWRWTEVISGSGLPVIR